MAVPSQSTHASQLGEIHRFAVVVASSPASDHGPDVGSVATSHTGGGAGWWQSVRHGTHGGNCPRRGPEFKAQTLRRPPYLDPKGRGDKSMVGKREMSEDVYGMVPQRLRDTVRAGLPEPQCPAVELHTRR